MILLPGTQRLSQDNGVNPYGASPKPTQQTVAESKPEEESEYEESEYETETEEEEEGATAGGQNGGSSQQVNGSTNYEESAERALEEAVAKDGEELNLDYIDEDNEDEKPVSSPRLNRYKSILARRPTSLIVIKIGVSVIFIRGYD